MKQTSGRLFSITLVALLGLTGCSDSGDRTSVDIPATPAEPELIELSSEVTLVSGPIAGHDTERSETWEWLAIPYAVPPVDELRWVAPRDVEPWTDTLATTEFGELCPQIDPFGSGAIVGSEDCLHLNVWRPRSQDRDLPVYVWIHGGGNNSLGNSFTVFQGDRFAEANDVVVVSIQYRLGALGWFYYPALHTGDAYDDSGNYGTLDIIHSLRWVQDNIEAFGGDPGNVTIVGESAGAWNVISMILSPEASGLFHGAISQSGWPKVNTTDDNLASVEALFDNLTADAGAPEIPYTDEEKAQIMLDASAEDIISATDTTVDILIDGTVIPATGNSTLETGDYPNKVRLMLGTTDDECRLFTSTIFGEPAIGGLSEGVTEALGHYCSDMWQVVGADLLATRMSAHDDQPDIYVYRFDWGSINADGLSPLPGDLGATLGACHACELPFTFGNWDEWAFTGFSDQVFTPDNEAGRENLSDAIVAYWGNFAVNGDPNGDNLPTWQPFDPNDGGFKAIVLDTNLDDDSALITEDYTVFTEEGVLADLAENVPEPDASLVRFLISLFFNESAY